MELRHFRYLVAIETHGSMTEAARAVGVGQPTLSESMRRLEAELGTRLLLRHSRGVKLTAAGELVLAHAGPVLSAVDALPTRIIGLTEGLSGTFTLGCYHSLGAWYLPPVFRRLATELPEVDLQVRAARSAEVQQAVLERQLDLALVINARPHPDLVIRPVSQDALCFVTHKDRLVEQAGLEVLKRGPLFYPRQDPFPTLLERLAALGLLPERCVPLDDLELAKALVASGNGVGLLPLRVAQYGGSGLVPIDPTLPRFDDTVHLIMRYDTPRTAAIRALRELIVDVGKESEGLEVGP